MIQMAMLRKLYQNRGAVSAIWTILGKVVAGALVASACVPQNKSESILQTSSLLPSETKVDSVDLAFLWPLPSSESKIRDMISAEDVLSSELFSQVVQRATEIRNLQTVHGSKVFPLFKSGIKYSGKRPERRASNDFAPARQLFSANYGDINKWKVVAFRFDPCAPSPGHNHRIGNFNEQDCLRQLRFTIQPLIVSSEDPPVVFGRSLDAVIAGDYTMHVVYNLESAQSGALARDLLGFKNYCQKNMGFTTTGFPVGVHPCLTRGNITAQKSELVRIIRKHLENLDDPAALAHMGTQHSQDPWIFMNGRVDKGKFIHLPVESVVKASPGKVEPFANGWFQMATLVMNPGSFGGLTETEIAALNSPVAPTPNRSVILSGTDLSSEIKPAAINFSRETVSDALYGGEFPSLEKISSAIFPARKKMMLVNNPKKTDFFNSDCVSCHVASVAEFFYSFPGVSLDLLFGSTGANNWDEVDPKKMMDMRRRFKESPNFYFSKTNTSVVGPSYPPGVGNHNQAFPYTFIHFGYFEDRPIVSRRIANEASEAAHIANKRYFGGGDSVISCDQKVFSVCLETNGFRDVETGFTERANSVVTQLCAAKACPPLLKDLGKYFGGSLKRYVAKVDGARILDEFESECKVAKGTEFYAEHGVNRFVQDSVNSPKELLNIYTLRLKCLDVTDPMMGTEYISPGVYSVNLADFEVMNL